MSEHTPGPWEIAQYKNHLGYSIWAKDAGCIAERWYPSEQENAPIEANARLISAAPELLHVVKLAIAWLAGDDYTLKHSGKYNVLNAALSDAIAKAEGRGE